MSEEGAMSEAVRSPRRIYLDHNATTPIDPQVIAAMAPYLHEWFGNPSSIEHEDGHTAARAVDEARTQVAETIGARAAEIVFTGSCTEANNLAVLGVARALPEKRHLIVSQIEHPSVLEPARALEREGWRVTYLGVDDTGRVSPEAVAAAITDKTALVSVMAANNELARSSPSGKSGRAARRTTCCSTATLPNCWCTVTWRYNATTSTSRASQRIRLTVPRGLEPSTCGHAGPGRASRPFCSAAARSVACDPAPSIPRALSAWVSHWR